jgi:hypothetical protein
MSFRTPSARRGLTAGLAILALALGSVLGGAAGASTSTARARPSRKLTASLAASLVSSVSQTAGIQAEAQQFTGTWTQVSDPGATSGTAVVTTGGLSTATSAAPGGYLLSARVRSTAARIELRANGQRVAALTVSGGWTTVSAPVRLDGSTTWGLVSMPLPQIGLASQPVYVDWLSLQPTTLGYTTIGNKILDPSGRALTPRGVNRASLQADPKGWWMNDNDFQAMYLWGATIVRLPLGQQFWLSSSCSYDPNYAARVDAAVQSITKRGMIALLDLHTTLAGQSCGTFGRPPMADDYSLAFWQQVAARYKSNPLVAFELYNEPHYITDAVWHDGGMVGSWHAVGMQQLYNTVRSTGATNLVVVDGQNYSINIDVALRNPVDGYGIVYAPHLYNNATGLLPVNIDSLILPVAASYPVVITEFGTTSGPGTYNASVINYAESHGLGWAAWLWWQAPADYALLQSLWTYEPSPAGQPVRAALWKARGWTTWGK